MVEKVKSIARFLAPIHPHDKSQNGKTSHEAGHTDQTDLTTAFLEISTIERQR
jgi:hypothetical protein